MAQNLSPPPPSPKPLAPNTQAQDLKRLGMLAELSPDGLIAVRAERHADGALRAMIVTIGNRQAAELLACTPAGLYNKDLLLLLPYLARPENLQRLSEAVQAGVLLQIDVPSSLGTTRRWLRLTLNPVDSGIVVGVSDVTDLRRTLFLLERANLRLEQQKSELVALNEAVEKAHAELVSEIEVRKKLESELRVLAQTDVLTGLTNRRNFIEKALGTFVAAQRYRHAASILTLDVDHFKSVNDQYGHAAGDAVLQTISLVMSTATRIDIDIPARLGGEEFAILLPHTDEQGGIALGERIRSIIETTPTKWADREIYVTASIGVAARLDAETYEATLHRADAALYAAKRHGRNRCIAASRCEVLEADSSFLFV